MIREWHMKRGFVTLLVIGFVMMALRFYLEPHHLENAFHTLGEQFEYFAKNNLQTPDKPNNNSESDLELSVQKGQLPPSKTLEQPSTALKCSYDVS